MTRHKSQINQIRSLLYESARLLGDANAMSKGPEAIEKRIVRRVVGREAANMMRRWLR